MVLHGRSARGRVLATDEGPWARVQCIPAEPGIIFGDMCVFAVFFAAYLHARAEQPALFADSQGTLNRNFGAINTLLLLFSSLLVVLAMRALRGPSAHLTGRLLAGAVAWGIAFSVIKVTEYHEKVSAGLTPLTNNFYMYYFVLTGLHFFHLIVGMAVLTVLWVVSRKPGLSKTQIMFFEGGTCFWHMVDLLWVVLFPRIFLAR
jgi:nitric oxide reductase NorE protein